MNSATTGRMANAVRPRYTLVFWDWNGTLLDDRDYAIRVRNEVFPRFQLPTIHSVAEYHRQFTFPVRLYYEQAGVTDENFVEVANAWMAEYLQGMDSIPLHQDALPALQALGEAGLRQVILSASDREILQKQLAHYGIADCFDQVMGLSHIYATSKQAIGEAYLRECGVPPSACVLLGDTLHDAEVAKAMGMDCLLIANGHQSAETLETASVPVFARLREAVCALLA